MQACSCNLCRPAYQLWISNWQLTEIQFQVEEEQITEDCKGEEEQEIERVLFQISWNTWA